MFKFLTILTREELEIFFKKHPFRKKFIIRRMKKSQITFEENFYIYLKSPIHKKFWITEKHLLPVFFEKSHFFIAIYECPICSGLHTLSEKNVQILDQKFPLLIKDYEYIARCAQLKTEKAYKKRLVLGKGKMNDEEVNETYSQYAKELISDNERGKLFFFPHIKSG